MEKNRTKSELLGTWCCDMEVVGVDIIPGYPLKISHKVLYEEATIACLRRETIDFIDNHRRDGQTLTHLNTYW